MIVSTTAARVSWFAVENDVLWLITSARVHSSAHEGRAIIVPEAAIKALMVSRLFIVASDSFITIYLADSGY
jgi:hypothetical protein